MAAREYSVRMQRLSHGYVVRAHCENVTKELVFSTWDAFSERFKHYLDQFGPDCIGQLKDQVEKASYGVAVFPENAQVTEEVVKDLGLFA